MAFDATQAAQLLRTYISKRWIPALERSLQLHRFTTKVQIPPGMGAQGRVVTFSNPPASTTAITTNLGNPIIHAVDANHRNRGELLLRHQWEGLDLRGDYARDTLEALARIWKRPVHVETKVENRGKVLSFDGDRHSSEETRGEGEAS